MNKFIFAVACLTALFVSATASAAGVSFKCTGTLIITIGVDGPDKMTAVQATFAMTTKGKTAVFSLENKFAKPLKGTGKETGDKDVPWSFLAKDDSGREFKGSLRPIEPSYGSDTQLHAILEMKGDNVLISGPMSCGIQ
ncbi:MAG: hypothetical protein VX223_14990 [Myxococcota bacterium]|nr:hypothetical protein [Myxococcota bacterium]